MNFVNSCFNCVLKLESQGETLKYETIVIYHCQHLITLDRINMMHKDTGEVMDNDIAV